MAGSIGKRELKNVVKVLKKRSDNILKHMGKFMSNQGAGRTYASRQEKIAELKGRLNGYARTYDPMQLQAIMDNFTPLETAHADSHNNSNEGFRSFVDCYVETLHYIVQVKAMASTGAAQKSSLVERIQQKVNELAELRQTGAFTRYPLETPFPAVGDIADELQTYARWAYEGSRHATPGGYPWRYINKVIGGKLVEGTSASGKEKKHAQARLIQNMLSQYRKVYGVLGDTEVDASKLAKKCLKGSANERRQAVDRLFMTVVDTNTVNGVANYNNNPEATTAAKAFFGLYKFYKTLERM